jgi:hypothetical protein
VISPDAAFAAFARTSETWPALSADSPNALSACDWIVAACAASICAAAASCSVPFAAVIAWSTDRPPLASSVIAAAASAADVAGRLMSEPNAFAVCADAGHLVAGRVRHGLQVVQARLVLDADVDDVS